MVMNPATLRTWGLTTALTMALLLIFAVSASPAHAVDCQQADGTWGVLNGTTDDDAGCITEQEYAEAFSVTNLENVGVITDVIDNGNGTVTAVDSRTGAYVTLIGEALERPVAATPSLEPDAPTVREILFPFRPLAWR